MALFKITFLFNNGDVSYTVQAPNEYKALKFIRNCKGIHTTPYEIEVVKGVRADYKTK